METTRRRQTIAPLREGTLRLPASVVRTAGAVRSPYFQIRRLGTVMDVAPEIEAGRLMKLSLVVVIKAFLSGFQPDSTTLDVTALVKDSGNSSVAVTLAVPLTITASDTGASVNAAIQSTVQSYCTTNGFPVPTAFEWLVLPAYLLPSGFASAPQAAIADCPADAVTNYNTVTTILGALTGAVNTANTKQNQIATQLNSLLAELRTLGLISV